MWRLKAKINRLIARGILRLVAWVCNRREYGWDVWYLLGCLRGFDGRLPAFENGVLLTGSSTQELKNLTTERIRAVAGFSRRRFLVRELPLLPEEQHRRDQLLDQAMGHFRDHYLEAVGAIQYLYHYDLGAEEPWKPTWKS